MHARNLKRALVALAAIAALVGTVGPGAAYAASSTGPAGTARGGAVVQPHAVIYFELIARHSGQCLDVKDINPAPGATIQQWPCWFGPGQLWHAQYAHTSPEGYDYYELQVAFTGQCLDVKDGSHDAGAPVQQWPCWAGGMQLWRYQYTDSGYTEFVNENSGMCLDVRDISYFNGAVIQQWPCWAGPGQQWIAD
jgi:hypothetical protein